MVLRRFRKKRDMPEGLWIKCPGCEATLFRKELIRNLHVCEKCSHHLKVTGMERVAMTADEGSFEEYGDSLYPTDPLEFVDSKPYPEKLRQSIEKTGRPDAAIFGPCTIEGKPVVLCVLDFSFIGGSMGTVVGEKVTRAIELGTERKLPVIVMSASGGARMHEGALSLMQMGKTSAALSRHAEAGGLYLSVLTNPTTGGVMASFAALGDLVLAEPKALIGFAGPRVIEQTLRQTLPEGFQRSEFLMERGFVDQIVGRPEMRSTIARFIGYLWRYEGSAAQPTDDWSAPRLAPDDEATEAEPNASAEPSDPSSK